MEGADSDRSCEAERAEYEVFYYTTGILAHMFDGRRLFLWVLNVLAKVGEAMLIRIHVVVLERKNATHSIGES